MKWSLCSLVAVVFLAMVSLVDAASLPKMRPYIGVGLIVFDEQENSTSQELQLPLYEEPGLVRVGLLTSSRLLGNEWIFDYKGSIPPLIVSLRKGDWLRVFYDDAGREAWLEPENKGRFLLWEQFLKLQTSHLLPGLQPQFYQLLQQPGGKMLATLNSKQIFKVLKVENAWSMVMVGQTQIGWLRWYDNDNRLLFGFNH